MCCRRIPSPRYECTGMQDASKESAKAIRLFSEHEGILLDNTYTAKAAAGVIHYLTNGKIEPDKNILFWHTGGMLSEL